MAHTPLSHQMKCILTYRPLPIHLVLFIFCESNNSSLFMMVIIMLGIQQFSFNSSEISIEGPCAVKRIGANCMFSHLVCMSSLHTVCHISRLTSYYGNLLGGSFEEASTISSQFQSGLDKCCLQPQRECIIEEVRKPVRTLRFRRGLQPE